MKTTLYFTVILLAFFTLIVLPRGFAQGTLAQPSVRLVYFLPSDRPARPDRIIALRQLIKDSQQFFADEMERHEYGRKTFRVETDSTGEPVVHRIDGKFEEDYYYTGNSDFKIWEEFYEHFDDLEHIYFIAVDVSYETLNDGGACGLGGSSFLPAGGERFVFTFGSGAMRHRDLTLGQQILGGSAIIPASGHCFFDDVPTYDHPLKVALHELGHAFALEHDTREGQEDTVTGGLGFRLSKCNAEWLSINRFFNTKPIFNNKPGEIQLLSIRTYNQDVISLRFKVTDTDGLHQAQLLVPTILGRTKWRGWGAYRLFDCERLSGETSTIESVVRTAEIVDRVTLQIIDVNGNITWATFPLKLDEAVLARNVLDVNSDGTVDLSDLTPIASRYGHRGKYPADVNEDGVVSIIDVLLVAGSVSALQAVETFEAKTVQKWLTDAKQLDIEDEYQKKGIAVLEYLLTEVASLSTSREAPGQSEAIFSGHTDTVWAVAFSPNGETIASAGWDKKIRLWSSETKQYKISLILPKAVMSVAFSPDGQALASGSWDNTVRLWDPSTGELKNTLSGHAHGIESVVFSQDGVPLACGSCDLTFGFWDPSTGELKSTLTEHTRVRSVAFSPDGKTLASGTEDNKIRFWDPDTGELKKTLTGHTSVVSGIAFSPDGRLLASSGWDNKVRLWNTETGQEEKTLEGHTGGVRSIAFSPDGRLLASGSQDRTVRLWELPGGVDIDVPQPVVVATPATTAPVPTDRAEDVNQDKKVNKTDLLLVVIALGENPPANPKFDVNADGTINIADVLLVIEALDDPVAAAAPSFGETVTSLDPARLAMQLDILRAENDSLLKYEHAIAFLESLLAAIRPTETRLLANYPNPFNPETWIPYQLAKAADVTLRIYAANSTLVQTLALGHQPVGIYHDKSRAAYWDGRNESGEKVASGVYFYTLTVGDFTATRKMLIMK